MNISVEVKWAGNHFFSIFRIHRIFCSLYSIVFNRVSVDLNFPIHILTNYLLVFSDAFAILFIEQRARSQELFGEQKVVD